MDSLVQKSHEFDIWRGSSLTNDSFENKKNDIEIRGTSKKEIKQIIFKIKLKRTLQFDLINGKKSNWSN